MGFRSTTPSTASTRSVPDTSHGRTPRAGSRPRRAVARRRPWLRLRSRRRRRSPASARGAARASANGRQELLEVHLERGEDVVGPVLHLELRLAGLAARVVDDVLSAWRSASFTISVWDASRTACSRASPSIRSHSRLASASISWRSLTIQRACLISSGIVAHLVEDVVDLLAVDPHLVGERHRARVVHDVVQLVDEYEYVHGAPVYSEGLTGAPGLPSGKDRETAALRRAERAVDRAAERRDLLDAARRDEAVLGLAMTYSVSTSGASVRLRWFIWNSHSKSEITQPLDHRLRAVLAGELDHELREHVDLDVRHARIGERLLEERRAPRP